MGKLRDLQLPMTCVIETYGGQFCACGLLPLSTDSLCYGSNTCGVHIAKTSERAAELAGALAVQTNIRQHLVGELGTGRIVDTALPYGVQIHKHTLGDGNVIHFLHMANKLWVKYTSDIWLRPEIMVTYNQGEIEPGYEMFTWKTPAKCAECGRYINDLEYYTYEKYSFGDKRTLLFQYMCCLSCYADLLPSRGFKVPFNRLVRRTVPPAGRFTHWKNESTGTVVYKMPLRRIALNPDAFDSLSEVDPNHVKDKSALSMLFMRLQNDLVEALIEELNSTQDCMLIDAENLANLAHSKGINIRFLGKVAFQASGNYVREIAVTLILSRGIKHLVSEALSRLDATEDPRDIILSHLNHILTVADTTTGKVLWDQLADYIRQHWDVSIEKMALSKIHMPALGIAVCKQLRISFHRIFDINYLSLAPFVKSDLLICPKVLDRPFTANSVDLLLAKARTLDAKGRRTQWHIRGGPEREQATECYDRATRIAGTIYQKDSSQYADVALEFAKHLESLHEEGGNPLNSKWNHSAGIPSSRNAELAQFYYDEALRTYESVGLRQKQSIECLIGLGRLAASNDVISRDASVDRERRAQSIWCGRRRSARAALGRSTSGLRRSTLTWRSCSRRAAPMYSPSG